LKPLPAGLVDGGEGVVDAAARQRRRADAVLRRIRVGASSPSILVAGTADDRLVSSSASLLGLELVASTGSRRQSGPDPRTSLDSSEPGS
jgi:hypothetical protein